MSAPYRYEASARGPRAVLVVGLWWGLIAAGLLLIDLNLWIAGALFAVSLPAAWEMARGTTNWIEIAPSQIRWGSAGRTGEVRAEEWDKIRLDTRLDFSLRMSIVLNSGKRIRLPYDCLPRTKNLKAALDAAGIAHEHHHFSLLS